MYKLFLISMLLLGFQNATAQNMYSRAFGKAKNPCVIYLHGGPGYNCSNFEITTAQKLADEGFYVIVYDRRGEGRSKDSAAKFTFEETNADLHALYQKFNIKKASLIGHSFGGIVAVQFAKQFPDWVSSIVLVGAPISLQQTFRTIQAKSKAIYESKNDTVNLKFLKMLTAMDSTKLEYGSYTFMHAMQNGFYTPKTITDEAKAIYALFRSDTTLKKYAIQMTFEGPKGFWKNEHYTMLDLTESIAQLIAAHTKIIGLYGKEDGLYAPYQIEALGKLIGAEHVQYYDNCSHNVFIDQQAAFLKEMKRMK
ncbi:MAG: alpha/beta hydrolase [Bacteroidetes bacterium]|nr:alpha/beta hydrolase [Bacteroidota bacterium]